MIYGNNAAESSPSFAEVVANVRNGSPEGMDQLYRIFRTLSGSLRRQIGNLEFEDRVHDMFIVAVEAIREGKLREPAALPSYIHGIARLSNFSHIGVKVRRERLSGSLRQWVSVRTRTASPEDLLTQRERARIMRELLASLTEREREVLTRFYLREQTKEQICRELSLTEPSSVYPSRAPSSG